MGTHAPVLTRPIDRLEILLKEEKIAAKAFEAKVGISNGYIAAQKKGKGTIGSEAIEKFLLFYPHWDLYWLVTGKERTGNNEKSTDTTTLGEPDVKYIPFYDVDAIGGNNAAADMQPVTHPTATIDVGDMLRDSECAIRIYGNSMTPNYPSGCVVGLRIVTDGIIEYGNVYVIETNDNRYLKRLYQDEHGRGYMCYSDNDMKFEKGARAGKFCYEPFVIPFEAIAHIYRVTGVIKRNENSMIIKK